MAAVMQVALSVHERNYVKESVFPMNSGDDKSEKLWAISIFGGSGLLDIARVW